MVTRATLHIVAALQIMLSMITDLSQVTQSALSMPQSDRAKLASSLIRSLDPQVDDDSELVAQEWEKEILARSDALHRGEVQFVEGEEVIAELRTLISNSKSATSE